MMACRIRKTLGGAMTESEQIEQLVRTRLRSLRNTLALSLTSSPHERTSARPPSAGSRPASGRSASTSCSRWHEPSRSTSTRFSTCASDDDVIIRPTPSTSEERTTWMLSRSTGNTTAVKMRLEPTGRRVERRVHPGNDWFFVLEGASALVARRPRDHGRDRRGRRVRHHDAPRLRSHRRPARHHDLRSRQPTHHVDRESNA